MLQKIKEWFSSQTASGVYAYSLTKFGDRICTKTNLQFMNPFYWYLVGVALFFIFAFGLKRLLHRNTKTSNKQKELIEIVRRHYTNETVILDGYNM